MRWEKAKAVALERDRWCLSCRSHDNLDVHHRRARGMGGTSEPDRLSNLITLCRRCHDITEANPDRARTCGYRLDAGQDPTTTPIYGKTVNGDGWHRLDDEGGYLFAAGPDSRG